MELTKILPALLAAQKQFPVITKGKKGARGKFASLATILSAIKMPMIDNGLVLTQFDDFDGGARPFIRTRISHISGEFIESRTMLTIDDEARMNASQKYGSACSYAKRYAIGSILGLCVSDEDADLVEITNKNTALSQKGEVFDAETLRKLKVAAKTMGLTEGDLKACAEEMGFDSIENVAAICRNELFKIMQKIAPPKELNEAKP